MGYLPDGYSVPKTPSDYMKWELGTNKFRIVGKPSIGYVYFNTENKPVRLKEKPQQEPQDLGTGKYGKSEVRHFWALKVYNFNSGKVELLEITQVSIMQSMEALFSDEDWGTPENYNITVTKSGEGKETRYATQPAPPSELTQEIKKQIDSVGIDFKEFFEGGKNVFIKSEQKPETPQTTDEVKINEVPFN